MPERFTETLRAASEPGWSHAVGHRFVKELFTGAMPDAVMARYLIQDHRFLDSFLTLLGAVLASADTFEAKLRFARFIGMVSGEENTYFLRAFEALGVTEVRRAADPDTQPTAGFQAIMREAAQTRSSLPTSVSRGRTGKLVPKGFSPSSARVSLRRLRRRCSGPVGNRRRRRSRRADRPSVGPDSANPRSRVILRSQSRSV